MVHPGPQMRGTGGTVIVVLEGHRDRGHRPPSSWFWKVTGTGATGQRNRRLLCSNPSGVTCHPKSRCRRQRGLEESTAEAEQSYLIGIGVTGQDRL